MFAKIGAFTIGGGYMMVPAIEAEIRRRGWIPDDELPDIVALSQSAPGLLTVNMAIFAGSRLRGVKGSVVATLGVILAPFLIILAIAMFLVDVRDNAVVNAVFSGVRPAAVAIIAAYTVKLVRKHSQWWQWAVTLGTLVAIAVFKVSAVYVLLCVILVALAISWRRGAHK
ncbi:MAG: chromate transporter [Bacteroidales bacterium]|nr:chromate transporter [Bacteroidales bacterium]